MFFFISIFTSVALEDAKEQHQLDNHSRYATLCTNELTKQVITLFNMPLYIEEANLITSRATNSYFVVCMCDHLKQLFN